MNKKEVEGVKAKLLDINEFVLKLDPSIRPAAFEILAGVAFNVARESRGQSDTGSETGTNESQAGKTGATLDLGAFISKFQHDKPADNVMLLAAWLYATYGAYPITPKEIKELGDSCGLITPGRADNTMRQAKRNGKGLFNQQGKAWKPTVSGELFFKDTYGVTKGNKSLPSE